MDRIDRVFQDQQDFSCIAFQACKSLFEILSVVRALLLAGRALPIIMMRQSEAALRNTFLSCPLPFSLRRAGSARHPKIVKDAINVNQEVPYGSQHPLSGCWHGSFRQT
ncbi:MAG TPA: hypothetical protein VF254_05955 [Gammaproteobacteria bacterium]